MAKIIGNPTLTPVMPSDWAQQDETKVDYIKNKPTKLSQFENDIGGGADLSDYYTATETDIAISNQLQPLENDLVRIDEAIDEVKTNYVKTDDLPNAEVAYAYEAYVCYLACCDGDENLIVDTYATKKEVGDIESVLDSILAIQETIVGGVN